MGNRWFVHFFQYLVFSIRPIEQHLIQIDRQHQNSIKIYRHLLFLDHDPSIIRHGIRAEDSSVQQTAVIVRACVFSYIIFTKKKFSYSPINKSDFL